MNIGDYVRTEEGIKRVGNYYYKDTYDNGHCIYFEGNDFGLLYTNEEYKNMKSSPDITDLLEVGDILKFKDTKHYQEVLAIDKEKLYLTEYIYMSGLQKYKKEIEEDLEWVITHEQIESMKYKVGDKE